jgi:hypothetical protein
MWYYIKLQTMKVYALLYERDRLPNGGGLRLAFGAEGSDAGILNRSESLCP